MVCFGGFVIEPVRGGLQSRDVRVGTVGPKVQFGSFRATLNPPEAIKDSGGPDLRGNGMSGRVEIIVSERGAALQHRKLDRRGIDDRGDSKRDDLMFGCIELPLDQTDGRDHRLQEISLAISIDVGEVDRAGCEVPKQWFHLGETGKVQSNFEAVGDGRHHVVYFALVVGMIGLIRAA